jgi:hypothetical protein
MDLINYEPASNQFSLQRKVVQPVPDNEPINITTENKTFRCKLFL